MTGSYRRKDGGMGGGQPATAVHMVMDEEKTDGEEEDGGHMPDETMLRQIVLLLPAKEGKRHQSYSLG